MSHAPLITCGRKIAAQESVALGVTSAGGSVQQVPLDGLAYSTLWKTLLFSIAEYSYVRAGCAKCWRGRRL